MLILVVVADEERGVTFRSVAVHCRGFKSLVVSYRWSGKSKRRWSGKSEEEWKKKERNRFGTKKVS
jgi:hypothetical protein